MLILRTVMISIGLLALSACAGTAEQQSSAPKSTSSVAVAEAPAETTTEPTAASEGQMVERQVCKRIHVTGTRFPKKVCMTKRQWKEVSEQAQDDINRNVMDSQASSGDGDG